MPPLLVSLHHHRGVMSNILIPLPLSPIQTLPPETLSEIFEHLHLPPSTLSLPLVVAAVCSQWHQVATGNSELWLNLWITRDSIEYPEVLRRVLQRSKGRPIILGLRFPTPGPTESELDYPALEALLRDILKENLQRCMCLVVHASEAAWDVILAVFAGETFPLLQGLYLQNADTFSHWQILPLGETPVPPRDLVFPLPVGHRLIQAHLQGVSFGNVPVPKLDLLRVGHHFPDIILDGRLNPRLFDATELQIERMCVPAVPDPNTATPIPGLASSKVEFLMLRELFATPDDTVNADASGEHDCGPFFSALDTANLRVLIIDSWDLYGRIWDDFIGALTIGQARFPRVEDLTMRRMDFEGKPYADVAFFLAAFPALRKLLILDAGPAWEDVIAILEICPTLCVGLRELLVDDGAILRNDPMPFRDYMFEHALPMGNEDFPQDVNDDESEDDYYLDL